MEAQRRIQSLPAAPAEKQGRRDIQGILPLIYPDPQVDIELEQGTYFDNENKRRAQKRAARDERQKEVAKKKKTEREKVYKAPKEGDKRNTKVRGAEPTPEATAEKLKKKIRKKSKW